MTGTATGATTSTRRALTRTTRGRSTTSGTTASSRTATLPNARFRNREIIPEVSCGGSGGGAPREHRRLRRAGV
ncbi:hypothetical protein ACFPRL_22075 [Pseudoclavibacter helvolus]